MANKKPAHKKVVSNDSSLLENMKKKWWAVLLLALFVFAVGSFAYNKYLDYKNVQDMKALLADFQELERRMEEETGEDFTIEADCSSVGKFATSYACSVYLHKDIGEIGEEQSELISELNKTLGLHCEQLFSGSGGAKNSLLCSIKVKPANEIKSEQIFLEYDKSPNSPY